MGFIAATEGWHIESWAEYDYPVYIVWGKKRIIGVAGDRGGLDCLLLGILIEYEKSKRKIDKKYKILSVTRRRTIEWEGHILSNDDDRDGDTETWPDDNGPKYHFVVVKPGEQPRNRKNRRRS
jgi:hypothetical protein